MAGAVNVQGKISLPIRPHYMCLGMKQIVFFPVLNLLCSVQGHQLPQEWHSMKAEVLTSCNKSTAEEVAYVLITDHNSNFHINATCFVTLDTALECAT